jgi:hypothetical protein
MSYRIKRRKQKQFDNVAKHELDLFIDNDRELYEKKQALKKNYEKRAEKGVYNLVVVPGARKYDKVFGGKNFDNDVRKGVATSQTRQIVREIRSEE